MLEALELKEGSGNDVKGVVVTGCMAQARPPAWRQPRGKWMVSLVNYHANATSKRWHLWEINLRFGLNSTPGWLCIVS